MPATTSSRCGSHSPRAEREDLADLGRDAASALQSALTCWRPGERDLDIQARCAAHLEAAGADAPVLIVGGDDRLERYRHPMAVGAPVRRLVMAVVVARRGGLHVAATRFAAAAAARSRLCQPAPPGAGHRGRRAVGLPRRARLTAPHWPRSMPGTLALARPANGLATTRAGRSASPSASSSSPRIRPSSRWYREPIARRSRDRLEPEPAGRRQDRGHLPGDRQRRAGARDLCAGLAGGT